MIWGFVILLIAGICQGSFGLGFKKYSPFSWAAFWMIYNILCIVVTVSVAWALAPQLWTVAFTKSEYWIIPLLCGALWGLSAIGFSKAITKIGMSMVYGISMGISTVVGSILPMLFFSSIPSGASAVFFAVGLIFTLVGVAVITVAGVKRDGAVKSSAAGIILAVLSGLGSGAMNVGFSYSSIGEVFESLGYSQAAISSGKWLPVLVGGCIMGVIWCIGELFVRREWNTVISKGSALQTSKQFVVCIIWYAALLLYGLSTVMLGETGSIIGWILFNSLALVISVGWGLKTGEWNNKPKSLLFVGCAIMIVAWVFTALV
ncbi:MAG: hypothetical protein J1F36_01915 [Clostridiales bacterium]|nr:hypothetical protein [Clostridiales bacterium]